MSTTFDSDRAMIVLGVPGRLTHRTVKPGKAPDLWFKQRWVSEPRPAGKGYPQGSTIKAEISFDDECGNGRNGFAVTATVKNPRRRDDIEAGGRLHEDVARVFPELAGLIKWHLSYTDGPMYYLANTVYHARNRNLDAARSCAVWPEATDEQLSVGADELKAALTARLPALLHEMRQDITAAGFFWAVEDFSI